MTGKEEQIIAILQAEGEEKFHYRIQYIKRFGLDELAPFHGLRFDSESLYKACLEKNKTVRELHPDMYDPMICVY